MREVRRSRSRLARSQSPALMRARVHLAESAISSCPVVTRDVLDSLHSTREFFVVTFFGSASSERDLHSARTGKKCGPSAGCCARPRAAHEPCSN